MELFTRMRFGQIQVVTHVNGHDESIHVSKLENRHGFILGVGTTFREISEEEAAEIGGEITRLLRANSRPERPAFIPAPDPIWDRNVQNAWGRFTPDPDKENRY